MFKTIGQRAALASTVFTLVMIVATAQDPDINYGQAFLMMMGVWVLAGALWFVVNWIVDGE